MSTVRAHYSLALLTVSYLVGEMGHFLLGATSRAMARELEYGDKAYSTLAQEEEECLAAGCVWDYTGRGLDYQVLAGPTFILVFSVSGVMFGLAADYTNRSYIQHNDHNNEDDIEHDDDVDDNDDDWLNITSRMRLLGGAVCLFSSAIMLTSVASNYWHLVVARMLLAAGESACSPVCVSLISDLYPDHQRGLATAVLHLGVYLGFGLSQAAGIYLTQMNLLGYSWRAPYFITGAPGILTGLLLLLLADPRGKSKEKKSGELLTEEKTVSVTPCPGGLQCLKDRQWSADLQCLKESLFSPFMLIMFIAAAFRHSAGFTWAYNCRLYFLSYYPQSDVGSYFSLSAIVGGAAGVLLGGATADRLARVLCQGLVLESKELEVRKVKIKLFTLGMAMILAVPFSVGVLYLDPPLAFVSLFCYYLLAETWFGIVFVTLVSVSPARLKTTVLGVFLFLMNNIGGNLPVLVNPISKLVGYREALFLLYPCPMFARKSVIQFTWVILY